MTQRTSWPRAALLALALTSVLTSPAGATGSAVYDAGAVAIPKTDYQVNPNIPSNEKIVAADWNQFGQYLLDCGTAVRWGYYHGLAPQLAAPLPPDSGVILFNLQDGGGFWLEYPDAGAQQVVLTLNGGATIPSIDAGSILTGSLTTTSETVTGTGAAGFEYTAPHIIATTDLASSATLESGGKATLDNGYVPGEWDVDGGIKVHGAAVRTVGRTSWSGFVPSTSSPEYAFMATAREAGTVVGCTWVTATINGAATGALNFSMVDEDNAGATVCTGAIPCNGDGGPGTNWGSVVCTGALVSGHHYVGGETGDTCSVRPGMNFDCDLTYP